MLLTTLLMLICAATLLFTVAQALHSGVAVSPSRVGPATVYALAERPLGYWLTLLLHSGIALLLGGLGGFCWWLSRQR